MMNEYMRAQMRQATRTLMADGAGLATAAIQKALKDMPGMNAPSGTAVGATVAMPDFVADLLERLGLPSSHDGSGIGENLQEEVKSETRGGGQFLTKSFTNHAGTRNYKLYIPASFRGQPMPLMVMLHGCTQNPDDFANGTRMNAVAEEQQCFVVYPTQAKAANSSKCWNWFKAVDQQRGQGEPSIIAGITREVVGDYKLDAGKVYVAGLSAGGAMAIIMGTAYPDLYAAVGVHSGLPYAAAHDLPSALAAMKGGMHGADPQNKRQAHARLESIPIIVFHGDRDTTVNARNSDQLMEQHVSGVTSGKHDTANRIEPTVIVQEGKVPNGHRYTRTSHHDDGGHTIAEHWMIHGAGHAWAGGSQSGSYTDAKGPDATREMLRFFYTQAQGKSGITQL